MLFSGMVLVSVGLARPGELQHLKPAGPCLRYCSGLGCHGELLALCCHGGAALFSLALFKTSTFAIGIWGNLFARSARRHAVSHPLFLQLGSASRARRG